MASLNVLAFVYQVGTEIRASVVTRSVVTDANGNDKIVPGHSNMAVSDKGGTDTASLFKALSKIPAAKHLASSGGGVALGHEVKELGKFSPDSTTGIANLFVVGRVIPDAPSPDKAAKSK